MHSNAIVTDQLQGKHYQFVLLQAFLSPINFIILILLSILLEWLIYFFIFQS